MQHVRLGRRCGGTAAVEGQVDPQLRNLRKRRTKCLGGVAIATPTLAPLLARGLRAQGGKSHLSLNELGSCGAATSSGAAGLTSSVAVGSRAAARFCCFSCCLVFRASSFCRLA